MIEGLQKIDPDYEERMLQFEIDCDQGKGDAWACHSVGEFLAVVKVGEQKKTGAGWMCMRGGWGSADWIGLDWIDIDLVTTTARTTPGRLQQGREGLLGELQQVLAPALLLQPRPPLPYVCVLACSFVF